MRAVYIALLRKKTTKNDVKLIKNSDSIACLCVRAACIWCLEMIFSVWPQIIWEIDAKKVVKLSV